MRLRDGAQQVPGRLPLLRAGWGQRPAAGIVVGRGRVRIRGRWNALERAVTRAVFACTLLAACSVAAQSNLPVPKSEDDEWKEVGTTPPAYPAPAVLVKFPTSWTAHEVLIDTATLNIAADAVVRYTLVIKTAGGAENVTYEGLRCETGQRRVYAFGRRDGTWAVARNADWRPIGDTRINRHYFEFWRDLFCDGKTPERRADILRHLPLGGRPRQDSIPSSD